MNKKTHYDILEVSHTATLDEIKSSYRRLIRAWHPDLHRETGKAEASEKTQEINQAYNVLSNKRKRENYDASLGQYRNPALVSICQTNTKIPRDVYQVIVRLIKDNRKKKAIKLMQHYDRDITVEEANQRVRLIEGLLKR